MLQTSFSISLWACWASSLYSFTLSSMIFCWKWIKKKQINKNNMSCCTWFHTTGKCDILEHFNVCLINIRIFSPEVKSDIHMYNIGEIAFKGSKSSVISGHIMRWKTWNLLNFFQAVCLYEFVVFYSRQHVYSFVNDVHKSIGHCTIHLALLSNLKCFNCIEHSTAYYQPHGFFLGPLTTS